MKISLYDQGQYQPPTFKMNTGSVPAMAYKKKSFVEPNAIQKLYLFIKWKAGMFIIISIVILLCILKLYLSSITNEPFDDSGMTSLQQQRTTFKSGTFYGIMLDAGSTGSRVHVYEFENKVGSQAPTLKSELFEQVKPGLSSYADNPQDGAASIEKLLKIAKNQVPEHLWGSTVLALKATAGLRLLPKDQSENLLNEVRDLFTRYPFKLPENPVMVMDGVDEGEYGWITVNYLLDRLGHSGNDQFTVGTIDLGGGSMQITFAPHEKDTVVGAPSGYVDEISVFGSSMQLYTHSYLGLGLMSAREALLKGPNESVSEVKTACMPPSYQDGWKNGQNQYTIEGAIGIDNTRFDLCRESARNAVEDKKISHAVEIKHQTFYVFSYFFDRAADMKMIDPEEGGSLTVQEYTAAAQKACADDNFDKDEPFLCMDLCLLSSFLEDGFGFASDTKLITRKTIDKKETSWTLGATFFLL